MRTALPTRPGESKGTLHAYESNNAGYASSLGSQSPGTESITTSIAGSNLATSPSPSPLPFDAIQDSVQFSTTSAPNQSGQVCR
jgi:hypothetical protein